MGGWKREASKMQFFFLSMPWRDFPKSFPNYHHFHVLPLPFCNLCSVHIGPSVIPWTLFALTCLLFPALNMFYIFCLRLTSLNFISLVSLFFFFSQFMCIDLVVIWDVLIVFICLTTCCGLSYIPPKFIYWNP